MQRSSYTMAQLSELVGQELAVSDWIEINQQRINDFAAVSGDDQWIHIDIDRASAGPFGVPIAHGLLCLALLAPLAQEAGALPNDAALCVHYGFDKIRFLTPVPVGSRVRCRVMLLSVTIRAPGQYLASMRYMMEIEGGAKPALVADSLGLLSSG